MNFGHVAIHRVAEASKAIIRARYNAAPSRAYFNGCSNGGRQALMEAQRYPDDFDGIVAGAPAYDFTGLAVQFIKDIQAAFPDKESLSKPLFPNDTLKSVETQIVAKCDALDGVDRWVDGRSAAMHGRCVDADGPERSAEEGAGDDLR